MVDARDLLVGKVQAAGPAVILGAGYVGMETADFLIAGGIKVTLIEMLSSAPVEGIRPTATGSTSGSERGEAGSSSGRRSPGLKRTP